MFKHLFSPIKINRCEIPNRLMVTAMVANYCNEDERIDCYRGLCCQRTRNGLQKHRGSLERSTDRRPQKAYRYGVRLIGRSFLARKSPKR